MRKVHIIFPFVLLTLLGCNNKSRKNMETFLLEKKGFNSVALFDTKAVVAHLENEEPLPVDELPGCLDSKFSGQVYHPIVQFQFPDEPEVFVEYGLLESEGSKYSLQISVRSKQKSIQCIDTSELIGWGTVDYISNKTYIDLRLNDGRHSVTLPSTLPETGFDHCAIDISSDGEYEVVGWNGIL